MKAYRFLFAAALAASFAACADEDYISSVNNGGNTNLNGKLVEAGLLGVGRTSSDAQTKGYDYNGKFIWMPTGIANNGAVTEGTNARIGFCWTGMNNQEPEYSAAAALGQKVYTNYEYEHVGWLDRLATSPKENPCVENELLNGAFMVGFGSPEASTSGNTTSYGTPYQYDSSYDFPLGHYTQTEDVESSGDLHLGAGLFSTCNSSVFEGEYLVYFPYTDKFTKGQILANEPDEFAIDVKKNAFRTLSDHAFAIGYVNHYNGGNDMSRIEAKTLSGIAGVQLFNCGLTGSDVNIKKIIFYSPKTGIIYEKDLNAANVVAALKKGSLKDANLFCESNEKRSNSIYVSLSDEDKAYATVEHTPTPDESKVVKAYFPILPQTVDDLQIVLIDDQDRSVMVEPDTKTFTPNGNGVTKINLNDCDFTNSYMAVDEETLLSALKSINYIPSRDTKEYRIQLLKDITLASVNQTTYPTSGETYNGTNGTQMSIGDYIGIYNTLFYNKNIRITSDFGAKLTVATGQALNIKRGKNSVEDATFDIDVDVVVEGMGCCGSTVGKLAIGGADNTECNVNLNKTVYNYGALLLNNVNETASANIYINKLVNKYDEFAVAQKKTLDAASLFILGDNSKSTVNIVTLENEGNLVVKNTTADVIKYNNNGTYNFESITEAVELTDLNKGKTARAVNAIVNSLSNKGNMEVNKFTIVTVKEVFKNEADEALIQVIGSSASATDGRLDVAAGTSENVGTIDNTGVINMTGTNLDNNGLFIDRTSGQVGGKYVDNGTSSKEITKYYAGDKTKYYTTDLGKEGIYVSQVETDERMAFVLSDEVEYPSTVIVEILDCDKYFFNLEAYENDLSGKDVYVKAEAGKVITFKAYTDEQDEDGYTILSSKSFGHCVEVFEGCTLQAKDGLLSTVNNVKVNAGATFLASTNDNKGSEKFQATEVTVGGSLINLGTSKHTAKLLTVNKDIDNDGEFTSQSTFAVVGTINVGHNETTGVKFISEGTDNTAGAFNQKGGESTFAARTTTRINGRFDCTGGTFERLGLNGGNTYRATVNVDIFGSTEGGTTTTAWPTEF